MIIISEIVSLAKHITIHIVYKFVPHLSNIINIIDYDFVGESIIREHATKSNGSDVMIEM